MNKKLILPACCTLLSFQVCAAPNWYGAQSQDDSKVLGYGQGASYREAKAQAYDDLARNIEVRVVSKTESSKTFQDGKLTKSAGSTKSASSDIVFRNNVVVSNSTALEGTYYVALQYNKAGFYQKLTGWLEKSSCGSAEHPYWKQVTFLQNWLDNHQCLPDIDIERFAGGWQLTHDSAELVLPDYQYHNLFYNHGAQHLSLRSTKSRLKPGEYYFVETSSEKAGYLSLFQVYKNGSTGVLIDNQAVKANEAIHFPDKRYYDGIEALLENGEKNTFDVNIALLCDSPVDTSRFEQLDEKPLSTDEPGFNLILDYTKHCSYRMERLTITN